MARMMDLLTAKRPGKLVCAAVGPHEKTQKNIEEFISDVDSVVSEWTNEADFGDDFNDEKRRNMKYTCSWCQLNVAHLIDHLRCKLRTQKNKKTIKAAIEFLKLSLLMQIHLALN